MSQHHDSEAQAPATLSERQRRRTSRRWERRLRILSPFLGIPLVFCALALSMGIVRNIPQAQAARAQGRAVKARPLGQSNRYADRLARIPAKPTTAARKDRPLQTNQPDSATIADLDPTSISLGISNMSPKAARTPPSSYRGSNTR